MTRDPLALYISDLSQFAKSLGAELEQAQTPPAHLALLQMIARAAGHRNHQELRAKMPEVTAPSPDVARALRVFDEQGRMKHWPAPTKIQGLCLWAFWARMPPRQTLTEPQVNAILKAGNLFDDHVLLRRSMIDHRLVTRTVDGRAYERIEQPPPPDALALIRALVP